MKRVFALVLALALTLTAFTACGGSKDVYKRQV